MQPGTYTKPSSHHAGLENIWFVVSNFETVGARGRHTNILYYFIYLDIRNDTRIVLGLLKNKGD